MFLPKIDVFKDLRQDAVDDISKIAIEERHDKGATLFSAGDPAENFYVLVEGRVGLAIGDVAAIHYTVSKIGESFGWSSVVGRPAYSASAECLEPTRLLRIPRDQLERVFDNHARSGRQFFRRLALALGDRWLDLQRSMMAQMSEQGAASYGTGQIMGGKED
jgi:CRP-like cAMP-binding protein